MPAISTCPKCQRQVSIPAGVEAAAAVRCPLCEAEYPLGESLAMAPPELIPVVAVASQESAPEVAEQNELHETPAETDEAAAVAHEMPMEIGSPLRRRSTSWLGKAVGLIVGGLAGGVAATLSVGLLPWAAVSRQRFPRARAYRGRVRFSFPLDASADDSGRKTQQVQDNARDRQAEPPIQALIARRTLRKMAALARVLAGLPYPTARLAEAWKNTLDSQHHDAWVVATHGRGRYNWAWQVGTQTWLAEQICR